MSAVASKLITAEEFARMPNPANGARQELVKGEIIEMPPPQGRHGYLQVEFAAILRQFVKPNKLGWIVTESGTLLAHDPDTVRGPDVSFYSIARQPEPPDAYFEIAPDLAIEILSPSARRKQVRDKIEEYLATGVRIVWLVDPDTNTITVYSGNMRGVEHGPADTIDGGEVLPGFSIRVAEFFS
jgi:Uma2 family endonuclease